MKRGLVATALLWMAYGPARAESFATMEEALTAVHASKSDAEILRIYQNIPQSRTESDFRALLREVETAQRRPPDTVGGKMNEAQSAALERAVARCTSPQLHGAIASLLDEYAAARAGAPADLARARALIEAAAAGKDKAALPALRKLRSAGGPVGVLAHNAIAAVGDPRDFEDFLKAAEKDGTGASDLALFGSIAIDRIVKDVEDGKLPATAKNKVVAAIASAGGHESMPKYLALLGHRDMAVAYAAAAGMARVADASDRDTLLGFLRGGGGANPPYEENALDALDRLWVPTDAPVITQVLKTSPVSTVRRRAAKMLGDHQACEAREALKSAASDPAWIVTSAAAAALKTLAETPACGKAPPKPNEKAKTKKKSATRKK